MATTNSKFIHTGMSFPSMSSVIFLAALLLYVPGFSAEPPIKVGATVSLEGKYVETSRMIKYGYEMWESQVNQKGGILGRKVELILYDDKSRLDLVRKYYTKLIEEDGVELVLSPYGTPLTLVASEISEKHKKVMIACGSFLAFMPWPTDTSFLFMM